jgi:SnoaL-like domain
VNLHSVRGGKVESGSCGLIVGALYENEFVKEDGRWRILRLKYRLSRHSAYDRGSLYPEIPGGPDYVENASPDALWLWPASSFPFVRL